MLKYGQKSRDLSVYMSPVEYSQLRAIVSSIAPRVCLEWGSGGSTRALLEDCPFITRYVSIEHDSGWHAHVAERIRDPRLSYHLVPPDVPPVPAGGSRAANAEWDERAEVDPAMLRSYVGFPRSLGLKFEFVLVDGRARNFCIVEGLDLLTSRGVLVLHDAQRPEHQAVMRSYGEAVFLTPWKQGQIALVRKP
jgi:hypothetical protein